MWFNGISLNICLFRWYLADVVFRNGRPTKTSQNEHLWHQNDSQSLFWFIVTAAQRERDAESSSLQETMDKSFHINLHIYRLPEKKTH